MSHDEERKARELGEAADIAEAIVYRCSTAGSHITGADLLIDGGRRFDFVPSKPPI